MNPENALVAIMLCRLASLRRLLRLVPVFFLDEDTAERTHELTGQHCAVARFAALVRSQLLIAFTPA
jgi:hypothetical protein